MKLYICYPLGIDVTITPTKGNFPVAEFSTNTISGSVPLSMQFTDRSQNATGWNWNFGDGTNSTQQNPSHVYTQAGTYTVTLTASNAYGSSTLVSNSLIKVSPIPAIVADFNSNVSSGTPPLTVQFNDLTTGSPTTWEWDLNSDGLTDSKEKNPVYQFNNPGIYTVTLRAGSGTAWGIVKKTNYITVGNVLQATFIASPGHGEAPLNIQFTDTSIGAPTAWFWDFGDRTNSTQPNPMHTYSAAVNYTVNLTAINANGTDSKTLNITVHEAPIEDKVLPVANFKFNVTSGPAPLSVLFSDLSQNAAERSWDFNSDGAADSSDVSPVYVYTAPGNYIVSLKVNNENGTASETAIITVLTESNSSIDNRDSSHSSGGGSGGGGAGVSPEPQSNVEAKEISQTFIASGSSVKFDFSQKATPVLYLSFNSNKTTGKTTTIVEMLKGKSTLVSELPSGEVYKSLNIWVGKSGFATPNNIENAIVCFKVEKSWIQDKNIDMSFIALNRYIDGNWTPLSTNLSGEDETFLYFTAKTPGFSPLAITGKTAIKKAVTETQSKPNIQCLEQNTGNTAVNTEQTPGQTQSPNTSEKGKTIAPSFDIVCGIVSLLAVFLHKKNKKHN